MHEHRKLAGERQVLQRVHQRREVSGPLHIPCYREHLCDPSCQRVDQESIKIRLDAAATAWSGSCPHHDSSRSASM